MAYTTTGPATRRRWLRIAALVVPGALFVAILAFGLVRAGGGLEVGDAAPAFDAPLLERSGTLGLEDLRGKPVVLNFWASWCDPCRDEMPMLVRADARLGDRIQIVGVNARDGKSNALAFLDEFDVRYPNVRDETARIYDAYGLTGQPETFFIDSEGVIIEHVTGAMTEELFVRHLDVLLTRDRA